MAVPTRVQFNARQLTQGNAVTKYSVPGTSTVLSGNAVFVCVQWSGGATAPSSVTDDQSNAYTKYGHNTGDPNQDLAIYYRLNIVNAARTIIVNFASATAYVSVAWVEFMNIHATTVEDGNSTGFGTGTALATGAFTPSGNGDLVLAYGVQDGTLDSITSWAAGTNFTLLSGDILDSTCVEFYVQPSSASITPAMTQAPSNAWGIVASAFKSASQGTAPTGMYVAATHGLSLQNTADPGPSSTVVQFPCSVGNLLLLQWNGAGGLTLSSVTDSSSNSWVKAGADVELSGSGKNQAFHVIGPTLSQGLQVTLNHGTSATMDSQIYLHEIVGAAASPYDTASDASECTATGTHVAGDITGATIHPSTANGLVFSMIGVASNNITANATGNFIGAKTVDVIATSPIDENQGATVYKNPDLTAITNVYTNTGGGSGAWADKIVAYKAPGSGSPWYSYVQQ